jgi:serine/threonine-protein kinase
MSPTDELTTCPQCGQKFPTTTRLCPNDGTVLEHAAAATTQTGQVLDGKYRLDAMLAEGGMGAVYRATHVMLGKTIAIKLIRTELGASPEIVRRFQREARAATALNHPNIVTVYDLGQTPDGTLYIAMEFIDGPSLKALIQSGRAIAPARIVAILRQVASALATAHKHNIIHRDLKPHNIMLATAPDGSEQAKLVDFGIAKTFDEATQLTSLGGALGTPYYMSPEQIEGRAVDARTDLYALGIILYEMLVGEVPFADQSTPAVLVKQLKERPVPPSMKNPAVPPALEAIALRCLEKDPEQRYQSADEFATALNEAAAAIPDASVVETTPMSATIVSGVRSTAAAVSAPAAAVAMGTKPTIPVQPNAASAAAPGPAAPVKSSMVPLMAIAAVLVLLAGGYLVWSGRSAAPPESASTAQADAPKATPAMATQEPVSTAPPASASTGAPASSSPPASAAPSAAAPAPTPASAGALAATRDASPAAANELAPSTAATREALASKMPPTTGAAAAVKDATVKASNGGKTARDAAVQPPPAVTSPIPENAAVLFRCSGAPDVCASLRSNVNDALDKAGFRVVTTPDRADIAVGAVAGGIQEKISQQFGQTFATRTYQIELSGEAPKLGEMVAMPPATTVSFDPTVGRERLEEKARLVASDVVDRVRAFVSKKRGG